MRIWGNKKKSAGFGKSGDKPAFALRDFHLRSSSYAGQAGVACRTPGFCLPSKVYGLKSKVSARCQAAAFTLIELLVAMSILMIITLMMANIFQQSTRAWDAGMRQTETGLEARAVINMIQRELAEAIIATNRPFLATGNSLSFYTHAGTYAENQRHYRRVTYSGELNKTIVNFTSDGSSQSETVTLLSGVNFSVQTPPGWNPASGTVPAWVEIRLGMTPASGEDAVLSVWSLGPDGEGTDPDLRTQ